MSVGVDPFPANAIGYALGLLISYILNSRWTFHSQSRTRHSLLRFLCAFAAAYAFNLFVLSAAMEASWSIEFAQAAGIVGYQIAFFLLLRFTVFRQLPVAGELERRTSGAAFPLSWDALLHVALICSAVSPFLAFGAAAGLLDLPNAIGRIGIGLRLLAQPDSSAFYTLSIKLIPNMAVDLWGLTVGKLFGAETAVNLFVAFSVVGLYAAIQLVRRTVFGGSSIIIGALSIFTIYGLALRWGFINYVFASGLMIWSIARLESHIRRPSTWFPFGQMILLGATYLSSIFPVVLYFVYAGIRLLPQFVAFARLQRWRSLLLLARGHLPGFLIVVAFLAFGEVAPPWEQETNWIMESKIEAVLSLLRFYNEPYELASGAVAIGSVVGLIWIFGCSIRKEHRAPLLGLIATFVAVPFLLKGVAFADSRLPGTIAGLALGLVQIERSVSPFNRLAKALGALAVVSAIAKPWIALNQIRPALRIAQAIPQLFANVPHGSIFAIIILDDDEGETEHYHLHLPLLQLTHGDFFFPEVFKNYFIKFRSTAALSTDNQSNVGLDQTLLCSNISHVATFSHQSKLPSTDVIEILAQSGVLSVGRIRRETNAAKVDTCPLT